MLGVGLVHVGDGRILQLGEPQMQAKCVFPVQTVGDVNILASFDSGALGAWHDVHDTSEERVYFSDVLVDVGVDPLLAPNLQLASEIVLEIGIA